MRIPRRGRRQETPERRELQREIRASDVQAAQDRETVAGLQGVTVGVIVLFASGVDPPARYWRCDGGEASRVTLADLYNAVGTTYGAGDGSTTFNLPDLTASEPADTDYWIFGGAARG